MSGLGERQRCVRLETIINYIYAYYSNQINTHLTVTSATVEKKSWKVFIFPPHIAKHRYQPGNQPTAAGESSVSDEKTAVAESRKESPQPTRPATHAIDDVDYRLITLLRKDGRMSTRELARSLRLTEATVRTRLRRLEDTHTMRVVAMTDYRLAGFNLISSIGVQVKGRDAAEVATDIARFPQVLDVQIVIGASDIEISVAAGERDELARLLEDLAQIPGVSRLNAGMALDVFKFQWGWVPFL